MQVATSWPITLVNKLRQNTTTAVKWESRYLGPFGSQRLTALNQQPITVQVVYERLVRARLHTLVENKRRSLLYARQWLEGEGNRNDLVLVAVMDSHSPGTNFSTKAIRSFPLEEYIENNVLLKCQPMAFKEK